MTDTHTVLTCPVCRTELAATTRNGIEIDGCPRCRGVWLDRGELDKLIERSFDQPRSSSDRLIDWPSRMRDRDDDDRHHRDGGHRHRRKSFLSKLFD